MSRPFDEARYKTLLDGLDATVVKLSEIVVATDTFRTDSEFWKKSFVQVHKRLEQMQTVSVQDISKRVVCGPFGSSILDTTYQETGILMVRPFNIKEMGIEDENLVFIPKEHIEAHNLKLFQAGALMFARVGEVACGVLTYPEATISPNIIAADISSKEFSSYFLGVFFNTKYGRLQMERELKVVAQPTLSTETVKGLRVPKLNIDFQKQIEKTVKSAHTKLELSKHLYAEAEKTLLNELRLKKWSPPKESVAVKSFSESFGKSGRLDAEHYHPKYNAALKAVLSLKPLKMLPLGELVTTITNGHTPYGQDLTSGEIPFITAEFVSDFRINFDSDKFVSKEQHENELEKTRLKNKDLLITIKGRTGNAAVVNHLRGERNINQDVGLLRLDEKYHPYYIAAFLNSILGKELTEQACTGQINPFLGLGNLKLVLIPIFETEQMNKLGEKIKSQLEKAYSAEQESKRLLELSKQAVEVAIEKGEKAGMKVLE